MSAMLEFENACSQCSSVPSEDEFNKWVNLALKFNETSTTSKPVVVGIRIVNELESAQLNNQYRHKNYATNVLSFSSDLPLQILESLEQIPLGDLAICAPVVEREASEQNKTLEAHWAHMVIHGVLHLQGFDHEDETEAEAMENLESTILAQIGLANPYIETSPSS